MKLYKEDIKDERNIQILSDDYIKFIRYCHWKIEQSGSGVVSLITKNTYLNIAAAKGLRKQLLLTFDKIYILNLHGKLYEKTPEGEKDDNVFDIRVGTAIIFLIKKEAKKKTTYGKLFYRDLYGDRALKYNYLNGNNILTSFSKEDEITILYSNIYRDSFAESLRIDYLKIPFTQDVDLFFNMAKLGNELVNLHLLKSSKLNKPQVKFQGQGDSKIDKIKYDKKRQVININKTQYFDNITEQLWNFEMGKNRVIQQYLKRKAILKFEDVIEFSRIATTIYETFSLQNDIDKIYPQILEVTLTPLPEGEGK